MASLPVHEKTVAIGNKGQELNIYHWNLPEKDESAPTVASSVVVVLYHGFLAHGNYPTVRYAAEMLAAAGYIIIAADLPGHGKSSGLRGYLAPPDELVQTGIDIARYASTLVPNYDKNTKMFLMGSSLGGAMALAVAHQMQQHQNQQQDTQRTTTALAGVVLLAPMLRLGIDTPTRYLLSILASIFRLFKRYQAPQRAWTNSIATLSSDKNVMLIRCQFPVRQSELDRRVLASSWRTVWRIHLQLLLLIFHAWSWWRSRM
ncbi:hypothetical protein MPSEU_000574300 [Mayamaea pseudoterrestris]|nr:hypothetical protein MPSEU_000574300 [Mayamaea pseudoterrestris]